MNTLITYYSETGNTEKIANAIYEEVLSQGYQAHLKRIGKMTSDDFDVYDLVFMGSACHDADLAVPVKKILEGIPKSSSFRMAGFATHATYTPEGGERQREMYHTWAGRCSESFQQTSQEKQVELLGYFSCQGAPSPPIEAFIHNTIIQDEEQWAEYIREVGQHPTQDDLEKAKMFAREVLEQFERAGT